MSLPSNALFALVPRFVPAPLVLRFGGLLLACAAFCWSAAPLAADASEAQVQAFRDWALRCSPSAACLLEQRIFIEGEKGPLMHWSLQLAGPNKGLMAAVRVPLEVVLPQGLALAVDDDAPRKVPFHHCRSSGCFAIFPVPDGLRRQLRAGLQATLSVQRLDGDRLSVPASLLGISAGLRALRERQ